MASKGDLVAYYVDRGTGAGLVGSPAVFTGPGRDDPALDCLCVFWAAGAGPAGTGSVECTHASTPTDGCWTELPIV